MSTPKPDWWQRLAERAAQPAERPRLPLHVDGVAAAVGSIESGLAERLRDAGLAAHIGSAGAADGEVQLIGPPDAALAAVARWLAAHGLGGRWRGELLPVTDPAGAARAVIERAAVRPLGIATYAVHLIGRTAAGGVWLQQRALDKATDPGLWDTLMGGLVAAGETTASALERETWEEAGLRVVDLQGLVHAGRITIRRPVSEGYMVEHIDVFEAVVPEGWMPVNQDGEVERFECLAPQPLHERLAAGAFTLEAALMMAESLRRRGLV
jgi:8-oxo-dGTP pyrophosphatase MutT (NUDIX family)